MIIVDVFVPGAAKTKGSMEIINGKTGAMKESVVGSSRWRALMAQAVRDDLLRRQPHRVPHNVGEPYPGAVSVTVEAYLTPPGPPLSGGLPRYPSWGWPIWNQAGDLDKIVRNVLDALGSTSKNSKMNGGAIVDDNLVCRIVASKHVASATTSAGVRIVVETL